MKSADFKEYFQSTNADSRCCFFIVLLLSITAYNIANLITCGAEPLLFLDYYVTDKLNVNIAFEVISGIVEGCKLSNCSLVGGETAEHPDSFPYQSFDLAGFALGIVDQKKIIGQHLAEKGDVLIGLASNGVHSNGFSLIRKIINGDPESLLSVIDGETVGSRLLTPTKIYVKEILELKEKIRISAISHITGGGFYENIPRMLNSDCKARLSFREAEWPAFELFQWIKSKGRIEQKEMLSTFNCGVGFCLITNKHNVKRIKKIFTKEYQPYQIGFISKERSKIKTFGRLQW